MKKQIISAVLAGAFMISASAQAAAVEAVQENVPKEATTDVQKATEKGPFKVAVFKVVDRSGWVSQSMLSLLEKRINRELHVPLNGYLQKIKVYPEEETLKAYQELSDEQKKAKDNAIWLEAVSDKLGADMVFCLAVNSCYEHTWIDWKGDTCYEAHCELEFNAWDAENNKPVKRKAERWVRDDCVMGEDIDSLAIAALEEIFAKEKIRDRFFPTSKKTDK